MTVSEKELNELRAGVKEAETPTLDEMNVLAQEISDLRDAEKEAKDVAKEVTAKCEAKENRMTELLLEHGMQNYRAPAGLASLTFRTSVRQPQGEERVKFYDYLKAQGQFDTMISVNSATLNSFYKEQFELAKERGEDDFTIPGLTEVKINPSLSFKRTK